LRLGRSPLSGSGVGSILAGSGVEKEATSEDAASWLRSRRKANNPIS